MMKKMDIPSFSCNIQTTEYCKKYAIGVELIKGGKKYEQGNFNWKVNKGS